MAKTKAPRAVQPPVAPVATAPEPQPAVAPTATTPETQPPAAPVVTPPEARGWRARVTCTVLDVLKHDGRRYGPAGNAAGWPDRVVLTPAQAAALAAAGVVAVTAVPQD